MEADDSEPVPTCPACNKPYAEHPGVQALCAENERLNLIVRAHTHREHGCLCGDCVDTEYDVAKVVDELRAELAAAKAREAKVREDVAELRAWLELVYSTLRGIGSYTPEPQLTAANQIDYVLSKLDELETFKEGT